MFESLIAELLIGVSEAGPVVGAFAGFFDGFSGAAHRVGLHRARERKKIKAKSDLKCVYTRNWCDEKMRR